MKRYIWLLLFAGLLVGCLPAIYVDFDRADVATECWIAIDTDNNQPIFHTRPGGGIVSVASVMHLPPDVNDENDYIIIIAEFSVLRYAVGSDGYWFEVSVEGARYFEAFIINLTYFLLSDESSSQIPGIPGETIYEEEGNIATGTYWIPESAVSQMGNFETANCLPTLADNETIPGSLPQVYYCSVSQPPSDRFEVEFRIGPGTQRAVRFVAVEPFEYEVHGYAIVRDLRWLQVNTTDYGLLWVNESHVATDGNCTIIPEASAPPTITYLTSPEEGSCTDFHIISPRGQVAEENSLYSWTGVNEADEYVLTFLNYLSDVSDVISVDGSQTSVEIYTGSLQTGSLLSFNVTAKQNGEILCTTASSGWIERLAARTIEEPEPTESPKKEKKDKKKKNSGYTPPEDYTPPGE